MIQGKAVEAFALFARAANAGIALAQRRVALSYFEGLGVPLSRSEGVRWLERAAVRGDVDSQIMLASMCVYGLANLARGKTESGSSRFFCRSGSGKLQIFRSASDLGSPGCGRQDRQRVKPCLGDILTHFVRARRDCGTSPARGSGSSDQRMRDVTEGSLGLRAISVAKRTANDEKTEHRSCTICGKLPKTGIATTADYLLRRS